MYTDSLDSHRMRKHHRREAERLLDSRASYSPHLTRKSGDRPQTLLLSSGLLPCRQFHLFIRFKDKISRCPSGRHTKPSLILISRHAPVTSRHAHNPSHLCDAHLHIFVCVFHLSQTPAQDPNNCNVHTYDQICHLRCSHITCTSHKRTTHTR